ncbi:diguanylate cyclase [Kineococcus sp. SYSU DK006]|uniref:GGDEF domain-containing protein n=1 Tax=Kineococcus sp. SYSU DK006 TaxID=3383127 RepID=UPI003D7ED188
MHADPPAAVPAGAARPGSSLLPRSEFGTFDRLSQWAFDAYLAGTWETALRWCREGEALCAAAGDELTPRYLVFTAAACRLELADPAGAAAEAVRLLGRLPAHERAWRAKVLALLADARLAQGRSSAAMDALAEAHHLAAAPGSSYNDMSAAFSTAAAFRTMLLFEHSGALLEQVRRSPWAAGSRTAVLRALALHRALWGCCLDLRGERRAAREQYVAALSAVAALAAAARERADDAMDRRALALEGFVLQRLGEDELALARIRQARAGAPVREELVEVRAARLATAVVLARAGRVERARALLAALAGTRVHEDRELWDALGHEALAEVETAAAPQAGPASALAAWRRLSELSMSRLWRERESRFEALRDRARLRALTEEAARVAQELSTDPLTGLGNRRRLQPLLEPGGGLGEAALLFVDVDGFKDVNDRWSHAVGDEVLRRLAQVVRGACREDDVAVRYGGDEFVVVLADAAGAGRAAQRLLRAVREQDWEQVQPGLRVRVSVGAAVRPTLLEALDAADEAMLAAKRGGRDRLATA